jgi:hypothetical protein
MLHHLPPPLCFHRILSTLTHDQNAESSATKAQHTTCRGYLNVPQSPPPLRLDCGIAKTRAVRLPLVRRSGCSNWNFRPRVARPIREEWPCITGHMSAASGLSMRA